MGDGGIRQTITNNGANARESETITVSITLYTEQPRDEEKTILMNKLEK
jgi:hypothetical protein